MGSRNLKSPAKFVRKPEKPGGNRPGEERPGDSPDVMEELLADEIDNIVPTRGYRMLPMVALGGSAGGIAPLQRFFESMPVDSGLVFVVILHLSPEHESILAELLPRTTALPAWC
jgi:two-component system, chemotaxis family, CheB/CheR fusion protein